jgi:drug/metabolite transporter (DMT)-like permease
MPPAAIPWTAYATLALSMAIVGSYVGLSKLLVAIFPVFLLAWLRFGIAAVAMLPWLRRPAGERPLSAHDRWLLFWESFLGNFGFSICMLYGVMLTSAVAAGVVMAAIPAATALLSRIFLGERISPRVAAGIACAVSGIVLLALAKDPAGAESSSMLGGGAAALGHLLLVGAAFCEASYIVIGKRLTSNVSPRRISALINLWGLALVTPLGAWQAMSFDFTSVRAPVWALLLFYSLAASVLTVWLWMRGLQRVPAARAGVFSVMLPVSAALVGVAALGEPFGAMHAVAFVLALSGLVLSTWPTGYRSNDAVA